MGLIRASTFEEFVRHYLGRERRKHNQDPDLRAIALDVLMKEMRETWPGKLRPWFERARWSVVSLDALEDAMNLVCLDSPGMREAGLVDGVTLDNRTARIIVAAAHETRLFDDDGTAACECVAAFRQKRIEAIRANWTELRGGEMLVLRSLTPGEKSENPRGLWYLHDGLGRLLAYLYAIVHEGHAYSPIEALLAEERCEETQ